MNKQRVLVCGSPDAADDVAAVCSVIATSRALSCSYEPHDVSESAGVDFMLENGDGFRPDDILVLLLGDEYGDLVDNVFSIPQLLYEQAGDAELERFVFLKSTEQVNGRQRDFLDYLSGRLIRARYETSDEAVKGVVSSLSLGKSNPVEEGKRLDFYIKQTDPKDEDETFKLDIQLNDLDTEHLVALVEADNRYLAKEGLPSIDLTEFLKRHKFAAADGRIYDRAFYLFPKSPLAALPPEEDPKEKEQKRLEKLKKEANESIKRMEASLDRDLKLIESVARTTEDDEVLAELTRQAFIHIYDEMQKTFIPTARKYGESEDAEYLTTYSFGADLQRICAIRNRNNDRLRRACEEKVEDIERFIERPFCISESDLMDGVPLLLMDLYQYVMPETDKEKKSASTVDLNGAVRQIVDEIHREGRKTRKTIKAAVTKPKKPKKKKKAVRRGTSPFAGKGKIRGCIEVSAKCDAITVNGRLYDKITGYEVWERINKLLIPFSKCDETPVQFTSADRLHFHRGKAKQFLDNCVEPIKEGRKIVKACIKPSLVPVYQREDEESGEAAKKPKFRRT